MPRVTKSKAPKATEAQIQKAIISYLKVVCHGAIVAAIPNGASRTATGRPANAVAGLTPGMPDMMVLLPRGETIFFEVKSEKGRVSDVQLKIHIELQALGHRVAVVRSVADTTLALQAWGIIYKH
jgi:hypothetical protein